MVLASPPLAPSAEQPACAHTIAPALSLSLCRTWVAISHATLAKLNSIVWRWEKLSVFLGWPGREARKRQS